MYAEGMLQRPLGRGGRTQHYYVSPVRYTVAAGGNDPQQWGAQLAGVLYVVAGTLLGAMLVLPLFGSIGNMIMILFAPSGASSAW